MSIADVWLVSRSGQKWPLTTLILVDATPAVRTALSEALDTFWNGNKPITNPVTPGNFIIDFDVDSGLPTNFNTIRIRILPNIEFECGLTPNPNRQFLGCATQGGNDIKIAAGLSPELLRDTLSHEFGHILGLPDLYDTQTLQPLECFLNDHMAVVGGVVEGHHSLLLRNEY